jgi:release factor glutamine methyltransferase
VRSLLLWATNRLRGCLADAPVGSAETPYLDSLLLLGLATGEPSERLMAFLPDEVEEAAVERFASYIERRCRGEPVSYIRGVKEFYGRAFIVSTAVLVPRPETELLVETALELANATRSSPERSSDAPLHVHDACTGSGCVAITLAFEQPELVVSASDIDPAVLGVARTNRDRLGVRSLPLWRSDLLDRLPAECAERNLARPVIITANPPYLTDSEYGMMKDRRWPEPERALRGGADGLDLVRRLAAQAMTLLPPHGYLIIEIGERQGPAAKQVLLDAGFEEAAIRSDLAGRDRVAVGRMD